MLKLIAVLAMFAVVAPAETVLVAPLANRTDNANLDWIGESIAESIREALAAQDIGVVRREERVAAQRRLSLPSSGQVSLASIAKIGETLNAGRIIYGEYRLDTGGTPGGRGVLRMEAYVLDNRRAVRVVDFSTGGNMDDLATLQSDLAFQLVKSFSPGSTITRDEFNSKHPPVKISAIENYVRGLMAPTLEQKHRFFTQAVRLDPSLWQACYYLGKMHVEKESYREAIGWLEKVGPVANEHIEATFLLGVSRYFTNDFEGAKVAFETVAVSRPGPEVTNNLGAVMLHLGQDSAINYFQEALKAKPSDADYLFNTGYALWRKGDFAAAANHLRAALDREKDDQDAILLLGRCLKESGPRTGDVRTESLERIKESLPN
jgi:tetratricopeptide (TPR) repeat protein